MTRAIRHLLPLLTVLAVLAPQAAAANYNDVLRDCADNSVLNDSYKQRTLNAAMRNLRGDIVEYSECHAVISAALQGGQGSTEANTAANGGGGGSGGGTGGGSGPGSDTRDGRDRDGRNRDGNGSAYDTEQQRDIASLDDAISSGGSSSSDSAGSAGGGGLSPLVILALIALACAAVAGGVALAARRNPALADHLRRVPLPGRRG